MENKIGIHLKPHGILREIHLCERGLLMKNVTSKSILIGNGININLSGFFLMHARADMIRFLMVKLVEMKLQVFLSDWLHGQMLFLTENMTL